MASVLLQNFGEMLMTFPALKMSHFPCMFYSINSCLKWYNSIYTHRTNMKLFILSHTLVLIKKIKGNKETSLVYFCYQSSNINCQKGNSYCEIAQMWGCFLMSGVKILHFFERLMEIHSNSPKLYYGFKDILHCGCLDECYSFQIWDIFCGACSHWWNKHH